MTTETAIHYTIACPHCGTRFKITPATLQAAHGEVRCGSCLQQFNALEQIKPKAAPEPVVEKPAKPTKQTVVDSWDDEVESPPAYDPNAIIDRNELQEVIAEDNPKQRKPLKKPSVIPTWNIDIDSVPKLTRQETPAIFTKYTAVVICLMITLLLQFLYFNKDRFALNSVLRPLYLSMCEGLDCSVPPLVNLKAIRSLELAVRTHPKLGEALQVDTVIMNGASFPQPYPNLVLTFKDIHNRVVARRSFSPQEYLAGELAGSKQMPVDSPIRISLEIMDPGSRASSYQLEFE